MSTSPRPVAYLHTEANGNQFVITLDDVEGECYFCEPLYNQSALDAAVAEERERCAKLCDEIGAELTAKEIRDGS